MAEPIVNAAPAGRFAMGIDVGGTFTDLVLADLEASRLHRLKALTTPADPSRGMLEGMGALTGQIGIGVGELSYIVHATTLVTNAIIERKGAATGLITTAGMRDVLEIGRESRYDLYDLHLEKPEPLVPRRLRLEVPERIRADGGVHQPLDLKVLDAAARQLIAAGVGTVAVCLINSYVNPAHEITVGAYLREHFPALDVSLSSEVSRESGEYERTSTTAANAYVRPMVSAYLHRLMDELRGLGFGGELEIMLSDGGVCSVGTAVQLPVRLIESGPAAGVRAATFMAEHLDLARVLSFDMGGTTAKIAFIDHRVPATAASFESARVDRARQGSGLPLQIPTVELLEIGAGGGSIAAVDVLGLLKVGPESAAADPGPASYGRGGSEPTITDANLLLGRLSPDVFGFGTIALDRTAAEHAMGRLAAGLALDRGDVTSGVFNLINEHMSNAARLYGAERARDLRDYTMVAYGGAGPVHAYELARTLGVSRVIYPWGAGTLSAFGLLMSPRSMSASRTLTALLAQTSVEDLRAVIEGLEEECLEALSTTGVGRALCRSQVSVTMRYVGQGHDLRVPLGDPTASPVTPDTVSAAFQRVYGEVFGRVLDNLPIELVTWQVTMSAPSATSGSVVRDATASHRESKSNRRPVYFPHQEGFLLSTIIAWENVQPGDEIAGPAIFESEDCTAVVGPDAVVSVDSFRNLVATISAPGLQSAASPGSYQRP